MPRRLRGRLRRGLEATDLAGHACNFRVGDYPTGTNPGPQLAASDDKTVQ